MQPSSQYPQFSPQQYPQQYTHYPQYPQQQGIYQQPMVIGNAVSQQYNPLPQRDPYMNEGGRQLEAIPVPAKRGGFNKLDQQTGVFIKQKFELAELVLGCETQNKYNVYALDMHGTKKGKQIFKAKESSDFCARYCLSGDCRPFKMNISTTIRGEEDNDYEPFLALDRPCKCTCLCFNRPEIQVSVVEGGVNEYIGKIVDPFNFCNMEMNIYDKDNVHKYTVIGSCCQLGVWCKFPCESCQTLDFEVKTASGEVVSTLQKRTPGCLQAMTTDMDSFALNFPQGCSATDKALLMSAVLFIDYRHFEKNPRENQNNNY